MYPGSFFPIGTFKEQKANLQTWVVTFYDTTAAYSLSQVWGTDAMKANLTDGRAQFPEGSVIVKVAMTTIPQEQFAPLMGAPTWQLYSPELDANGHSKGGAPFMQTASLLQIGSKAWMKWFQDLDGATPLDPGVPDNVALTVPIGMPGSVNSGSLATVSLSPSVSGAPLSNLAIPKSSTLMRSAPVM